MSKWTLDLKFLLCARLGKLHCIGVVQTFEYFSLCEGSSPTVLSTTAAASIMHDFNQSMSEYRREMRGSIAHLDDKINRLEAAVLILVERLPEFLQQPQQQQQQQQQQQPDEEVPQAIT